MSDNKRKLLKGDNFAIWSDEIRFVRLDEPWSGAGIEVKKWRVWVFTKTGQHMIANTEVKSYACGVYEEICDAMKALQEVSE